MIKFETWLRMQQKRDDPVGDLSRDFLHAKSIYPLYGKKCDEEHLNKFNAIPEAYKALKKARKEYEKYVKNNDR